MASDLFTIGASGVKAARTALEITSQNIANAATDGYIRRSVRLSEMAGPGSWLRVSDLSLSGVRVARELTRLIGIRGKPHTVVSDNGTELTSSAILRWSQERRVEWHYIAPGKPMQNGFVESFNVAIR